MDGCFRLVRKASSGEDHREAHHSSDLFIKKNVVDEFVATDVPIDALENVSKNL